MVSVNMAVPSLWYYSCLSFVLNCLQMDGLATVLISHCVVACNVRFAASIPMFQVEDNRSGVIMFFLLDETCEFVAVYEMVAWDFNDS
jgi:hypothetical protein